MSRRVLLIVVAAAPLWAQDEEADRAILPPAPAPVYQPPTPSQRFHDFASSTFGPLALLGTAAGAGLAQLDRTPPEWGLGAKGYGLRFTDGFGRLLVQNTIQDSAAFALREDVRYIPCECTGVWHRVRYSMKSVFTAKTTNGGDTFAISRFMGIYGGSMIETLWYPARYSPVKDGFRNGNWSLASRFGMNIGSEFWPDIRRKFLHKK